MNNLIRFSKKTLAFIMAFVIVLNLFELDIHAKGNSWFKDVATNAWYYSTVKFVKDNNIMNGVGNNKFAPNDNATRAMIVTMLYRIDGKHKVSSKSAFKDVKKGNWYYDSVCWASKNNIVNGYKGGVFKPNNKITRQDLAKILYNYSKYKKYSTDSKKDISKYKDFKQISSYAVDAMKWANKKGFINGVSHDKLSPKTSATRAQIATIITRFYKVNVLKENVVNNSTDGVEKLLIDYYLHEKDDVKNVYGVGKTPKLPKVDDIKFESCKLLKTMEVEGDTYGLFDLVESTYGGENWSKDTFTYVIRKDKKSGKWAKVLGHISRYLKRANPNYVYTKEDVLAVKYSLSDTHASLKIDGYDGLFGPHTELPSMKPIKVSEKDTRNIYEADDYWIDYTYPNMTIYAYHRGQTGKETISSLNTNSKKVMTYDGIRVGDSKDKVIKTYSKIKKYHRYKLEDMDIDSSRKGIGYCEREDGLGANIAFEIKNGKVSKIKLFDMIN